MKYVRQLREFAVRYKVRMTLVCLTATVPPWLLLWSGVITQPRQPATTLLIAVIAPLLIYFPLNYMWRKADRLFLTINNLVRSLNEGDYSLRGVGVAYGGMPGEVIEGLNELSQTLKKMRLGEREAHLLLSRMVAEVNIAVFIFDRLNRLQLANPAACQLYLKEEEQLLQQSSEALGLDRLLQDSGESHRLEELHFPARVGRFSARSVTFHKDGRPHKLLLVSDLGKLLIEQERSTWQQLLRVLGHEINNSLVPIKSMADTLETLVGNESLPVDWRDDLSRGLEIISRRADGLHQFIKGYSELTRLPMPQYCAVNLRSLFEHVIELLEAERVELNAEGDATFQADPSQLEQVLVNLLRNALDATADNGGRIRAGWSEGPAGVVIEIEDWGTGIANPTNLFVPFFTTKENGSGIGLTLCRQIVENHQGYIQVGNAADHNGCLVTLNLPVAASN